MPIAAQYDEEADALYISISGRDRIRAIELDNETYLDVDADGIPVGIEILYPSMGLNLQAILRKLSLESLLPGVLAAVSQTNVPLGSVTMTGGQYLASTSMLMTAVEGSIAAATVAGPGSGSTTSKTTGQLIHAGC